MAFGLSLFLSFSRNWEENFYCKSNDLFPWSILVDEFSLCFNHSLQTHSVLLVSHEEKSRENCHKNQNKLNRMCSTQTTGQK